MGASTAAVIWNRDTRCRAMLGISTVLFAFALMMTAGMWLDDAPAQYDVAVIQAVQDQSETRPVSNVVNKAGDYWWISFIAASTLVAGGGRLMGSPISSWRCRTEAIVAFTAALSLLPLNALCKALVESPRPDQALGVWVDYTRHTYGFPSGHVYNDVLFYGVMAVYAPHFVGGRLVPVVRGAFVGIILFAGWSRMVVGAHWPSDVLGGYLWGFAALALVIGVATLVGRRLHPEPIQI